MSLTFEEVAWAALFFKVYDDKSYMEFYGKKGLRRRLIQKPAEADVEGLMEFLNKYGMRIDKKNMKSIVPELRRRLEEVSPELRELKDYDLVTARFDSEMELTIEGVFSTLRCVKHLGRTGVSKVLGALIPSLFVMWDNDIANENAKKHPDVSHGKLTEGKLYARFLKDMHEKALQVVADASRPDPAGFICEKLDIKPALPMAKFLDEYNLITVKRPKRTNRITVPPRWHPCMAG